MRTFLLTFALCAITFGPSFAQVSKSDFMTKIDALNAAMDKKSESGQNAAFDQLSTAMTTQIAYLETHTATLSAAVSSALTKSDNDVAAAATEKTNAEAELKKAQNAINNGKPGGAQADVDKAEKDIKKAKTDEEAAHAEREKARHDKADFDAATDHLATEQKSSGKIQQLRANIPANKDKIMADLKTFAATLH